jgi:hypothetical protein
VTHPPEPVPTPQPAGVGTTTEMPAVPVAPTVGPQQVGTPAAPATEEYPPPIPPAQPGAADVVPGLSEAPPAQPVSSRRFSYGPRAQRNLTGLALVTLAVVLLLIGLTLPFGGASLWARIPLWSLFALVVTVLGVLAFVPDAPGRTRVPARTGWQVAVGGFVGLAVFWLLVALPDVATDRGFVLTAALAALAGALWIAPGRSR